ncbi:MAG: serine hydrolase, partial [Myxococcota bacterium]
MRVWVVSVFSCWLLSGCEFIELPETEGTEGPGGPPPLIQTAIPTFDIDLFVSNLDDHFDDRYAGAQIVVLQNGQIYDSWAVGNRTIGQPTGDNPMTVNTQLPVASVSKVIGSMALLQALEANGILLEQPIHNYLPESWKPLVHPDHFDAGSPYLIRFVNLMRNETALAFPLPDGSGWNPGRMPRWDEMLTALQAPADPNRNGDYQNGNFALIRVLLCEIELGIDADDPDSDYDDACSGAYEASIQNTIFSPLDIEGVGHTEASANAISRAYAFPVVATVPNSDGTLGLSNWESFPRNAGSGGLYLSSMELAKVIAFLV